MTAKAKNNRMSDLKNRIKSRVGRLSNARLLVLADFLAFLEQREDEAATNELLSIPGFMRDLKKAQREIASGKLTNVEKLSRKH